MKQLIDFIKLYGYIFIIFGAILYFKLISGYITLVMLFCLLLLIKLPIRKYMSTTALLIILFMAVYYIFGSMNHAFNSFSEACYYILPLFFFYIYGRDVVSKASSDKTLVLFILLTTVCYCSFYYYQTIYDIGETGSLVNPLRGFAFQKELDISERYNSTHIGTCISLGFVGLPAFYVLKKKEYGIIRYVFLCLFFLSLVTSIHLVNRSGIVESGAMILVLILFYTKDNPIKAIPIVLSIIGVYYLALWLGGEQMSDVLSAYTSRNEVDLGTAGQRSYRWTDAVSQLFISPMGWYTHANADYQVHNMWLDIAKRAGIIPFVILVYLTFKSIRISYKILKLQFDAIPFILVVINICFLLSCFIEPIFGGVHLALFMMFWGIEEDYYKKLNVNR